MEQPFDGYISKRIIEKVGCRAPYHLGSKEVPLCRTVTKMRESIFATAGYIIYTLTGFENI